ncbi:3934_t:CDS:1, partial [Acaulospora morrowiae]
MTHRYAPEAVDRILRDIIENDHIFSGKIVLFRGDFRQVLPVICKGTRAQIVNAALNKSYLWNHIHIFSLTTNMRVIQADNSEASTFMEYLLRIGSGIEPTIENDLICLPDEM